MKSSAFCAKAWRGDDPREEPGHAGGYYLDDLNDDYAPFDLTDAEREEVSARIIEISSPTAIKVLFATATRPYREQGMSDAEASETVKLAFLERTVAEILERPDGDDFLRELWDADARGLDVFAVLRKYSRRWRD
jgi:hypothetical protein